MKKLIVCIVILAAFGLGAFYWRNLRGIGPSVRPPPADITKLVPDKPRETNTTGMPLTLPPGFSISVFAKSLGAPRVMTIDPRGTLLVSLTSSGKVVALPDEDHDGVSNKTMEMASSLKRPHGLLTFAGEASDDLYVAEEHRVSRFIYGDDYRAKHALTFTNLPQGDGHFTRTLVNLPNSGFLVSVGSSCNACNEKDARRAAILAHDERAQTTKPFATGLRNSVFMIRHPVTGKIWATEMGRDLLGDDTPPDEINIIEEGKDYGWPICYGKNIHDIQFDKNVYVRDPCGGKTPSHIDLPAHSAPLGLAFIHGDGWPRAWQNDLLVAFHGSWNRSVPTGYKIVRIDLDDDGNYLGTYDFITGWLTKKGALGRPVDLLLEPDGRLYISDDKAGVIYLVQSR